MVGYFKINNNVQRSLRQNRSEKMIQTEPVRASSADQRNQRGAYADISELISNQSRDGRAEGNKYIILEQKGVEASEINKADQGEAIRSERSGTKRVVQRER